METHQRRTAFLNREANKRFRAEVSAWSASDTMRLPTREYLRHRLDEELEVLIEALGPWSEVDPDRIFPESDWEDWLS